MAIPRIVVVVVAIAVLSTAGPAKADFFSITNLVTNDQAVNTAKVTDANLKNPWGVSYSPTGPFWVSNNETGTSTLYQVSTTNKTMKLGLTVTIPGSGKVTGQAFSGVAGEFNGDAFLFVSEDGTVSGWRPAQGTTAEKLVLPSDAIYKGSTVVSVAGHQYLLAANFHSGNVDIFKGSSGVPDLAGKFTDPGLPSGFAPFNVQKLGGTIYVAYALQGPGGDEVAGAGLGIVSSFDLQGNFIARIASAGGDLNAPWGMAIAPPSFGAFAGDLLVGNFGDGLIDIYDPTTHAFLGHLLGKDGQPLAIEGLWSLIPGNDADAGSSQRIYFTAGPNDESNGLFGVLSRSVPEPGTMTLAAIGLVCFGGIARRKRRQAS